MTALPLPALDGRTPLGFLAALGVLRLVDRAHRAPGRGWRGPAGTAPPSCTTPNRTSTTLVADLVARRAGHPRGRGASRASSADFPPPGEAPDKLRLTRPAFAHYAATGRRPTTVPRVSGGWPRWSPT